jgi:ATP-dependent Clp protease adapter protein ClpS
LARKPRARVEVKTERPRLYKVTILNDDFTPREFVVTVLKGEFRVMIIAHRRGCALLLSSRRTWRRQDKGDEGNGSWPLQGLSLAVHH